MKRISHPVALAVVLVGLLATRASAQTVTGYTVTLSQMNTQSGTSTVALAGGTPYMASAALTASSDPSGTWTNVKVTPPELSATAMTYSPPMTSYTFTLSPSTASAKTGNWGFEYTSGTTNTATLNVAGSFISAVPVSSDNGSFVTGGGPPRWEFDPTQSITLSWTSPAGYSGGDTVRLVFTGPGNPATWSGTSETSHTFAAGYFQSGGQYSSSLLYQHLLTPYTAEFGGASGVGIFQTYTNFTLQAIPEPGTYAALFGVAALGFAAWRRRRKA